MGGDASRNDLVERAVAGEVTPCVTLALFWIIAPAPDLPAALRLARDREGRDLLLSPIEAAEAACSASEAARSASEAARDAAEARVAQLEAELRRRGAGTKREAW